jgi:hypothetical protein
MTSPGAHWTAKAMNDSNTTTPPNTWTSALAEALSTMSLSHHNSTEGLNDCICVICLVLISIAEPPSEHPTASSSHDSPLEHFLAEPVPEEVEKSQRGICHIWRLVQDIKSSKTPKQKLSMILPTFGQTHWLRHSLPWMCPTITTQKV